MTTEHNTESVEPSRPPCILVSPTEAGRSSGNVVPASVDPACLPLETEVFSDLKVTQYQTV